MQQRRDEDAAGTDKPALLFKSEDTAERYRSGPEKLCGVGFGMLTVLATFSTTMGLA